MKLHKRKKLLAEQIELFCQEISKGNSKAYFDSQMDRIAKEKTYGHALYEFCQLKV